MLRELTLLQFRSHRRSHLELDGRPVAIYGPNGAGKTNILEAISLLSPGRGLRRASAEELMRREEAVGWKLRATLSDGSEVDVTRSVTWSSSTGKVATVRDGVVTGRHRGKATVWAKGKGLTASTVVTVR